MVKRVVLAVLWFACFILVALGQQDSATSCSTLEQDLSNLQLVLNSDILQRMNGDVQNILDCLDSNATLEIAVPDLELNGTLFIEKPLKIQSNSGDAITIQCPEEENQAAILIRSDDVFISDIHFKNCNNSGGKNMSLIQIEESKNVTISNFQFQNNTNSNGPGCISAINSTIEMKSGVAENNVGTFGGVVSTFGGSIAKVLDCEFKDNHALNRGGAIFMHESTGEFYSSRFEGNWASYDGGAIYAQAFSKHRLNLFHVIFEENHVFGEHIENENFRGGGAVTVSGPEMELFVSGAVLRSNFAVLQGGALFLYGGSSAHIFDSQFSRNSAPHGGAIYMEVFSPAAAREENSRICRIFY